MATYVNDLRLKEIATGDESGTWGTSTNTNLELIAEAFSFGTEAITTNADTHTTTIADGSTDPGRSIYLKYTGTLDSACTITIGPNTVSKLWFIENGTSGSQNIIISQGSGANVTIPAGDVKAVYSDGAGSGAAIVDAFASLNVVDLKVEDDLTVTDDATVGGTLGVTGVLTANAGVVVDNITIDGTEIDLSSGDLTLDAAGDIILDADGGNVTFKDGGTAIGDLVNSSSDFVIESKVQDKDIIFKGDDGGSGITALTLDMSDAGKALFNKGGTFNELVTIDGGSTANTVLALDSSTANTFLKITDSNTNEGNFIGCTTDDLTFFTRNSERMRIASDGKVSIGTTTTDRELKLQKAGDSAVIAIVSGTSNLAGIVMGDTDDDDIGHILYNNSSNSMSFRTNTSDAVTIDSSGNVGIGLTSINATLNVNGTIRAENERFLAGREDASAPAYAFHDDADTGMFNIASNILAFSTAGSERIRITDGGKLFINTTAAVRGSETVSIDGGSADCFALKTHAAGAVVRKQSVTNGFIFLFENSSASAVGSITTDASNTTYNTSSDYRLKENIEPMQNGLDRLQKLNPVKFTWKETGIESEGFIAHEVDEVFSDCIYGKKDGDEIQSMDYGRITPLLVKAIQELHEQVDSLQSEIKTLKGE